MTCPNGRTMAIALALVMGGKAGTSQDQVPHGWKARGSDPQDYYMGVDFDVKYAGKASAFIRSKAIHPEGFGTLLQAFKSDDYRGKRLRMTAMVKTKEIQGWSGLWLRVDGEELVQLAFDNMDNRKIKGTTDWKRYAVVLDVPDDAAAIYFGVLLHGRGQAWVDDFAFEVVGKDVKTTRGEPRPMFRERKLMDDLLLRPMNLSFEE